IQVVAFFRDQEAVSVRMALHFPRDEVELGRDKKRALAVAQDLAVALHRGNAPRKRDAILPPDADPPLQLAVGERHARLRERFKNIFAARDGILVAPGFALAMRIFSAKTAAEFR